MSETKENWQKWRDQTSKTIQALQESIKESKKLDSHGKREVTESKPPEHPVHSLEELINCKDCGPKVKLAVWKQLKGKDHRCVNEECHYPVSGEESEKDEWKCPGCGGKEAEETG